RERAGEGADARRSEVRREASLPPDLVRRGMTKPVVHHVITRLIAGGAQENTIVSCQALRDRFDVLLITGPPDGREGSLLEDARRRGIEVRVIEELVRPVSPARDAAAFRQLRSLFESGHPDIVHTHSSKAGI